MKKNKMRIEGRIETPIMYQKYSELKYIEITVENEKFEAFMLNNEYEELRRIYCACE